jgi:hypothetical protein
MKTGVFGLKSASRTGTGRRNGAPLGSQAEGQGAGLA